MRDKGQWAKIFVKTKRSVADSKKDKAALLLSDKEQWIMLKKAE